MEGNRRKNDDIMRFKVAKLYACLDKIISKKIFDENLLCKLLQNAIESGLDVNYTCVKISKSCRSSRPSFTLNDIYSMPEGRDYTLLHYAVYECSLQCVNSLLHYGADFTIRCSQNGHTPLHLALGYCGHSVITESNIKCHLYSKLHACSGKLQQHLIIDSILSQHIKTRTIVNPACNNGISHFHIACMLNNVEAVEFFLNTGVSVDQAIYLDSPDLPGFTALHLAVRYNCLDVVEKLLEYCANVHIKNAQGMTALYILLKRNIELIDMINMGKRGLCSELFDEIKTNELILQKLLKVDDSYISEFHIVCTLRDESIVERYLESNVNINAAVNATSPICPGYTALHFAAHFNIETVKLLMQKGGNILAKDVKGVTALDLCMQRYSPKYISSILSTQIAFKNIKFSDRKTKLVDVISILHSRSKFSTFLQKSKSNIKLYVPEYSPLWPGHTILQLVEATTKKTLNLFDIYKGTDYNHDSKNNSIYNCSEDDELAYSRLINICQKLGMTVKEENNSLQNGSEEKCILEELTDIDESDDPLCVACLSFNEYLTKHLLSTGADVNAGMLLHRLTTKLAEFEFEDTAKFIKLLLKYGADVTLQDSVGRTPIWLAYYIYSEIENAPETGCVIDLLLENQKDYSKNPVFNGISHFHIACSRNLTSIVRKFLACGVDIDQQIDFFNSFEAGFTPLHLAMKTKNRDLVMILLNYGADITIENIYGNTPLQVLAEVGFIDKVIIDTMKKMGADMQAVNVWGRTLLEQLLKSPSVEIEDIRLLVENGCRIDLINIVTSQKLIAIAFECELRRALPLVNKDRLDFDTFQTIFEEILKIPNLVQIDEFGQNAIHHIVSGDLSNRCYYYLREEMFAFVIDRLMKLGCELDQRDKKGKTALHKAVESKNLAAIKGLLMLGAEMEIFDNDDKSPLSRAEELCKGSYEYSHESEIFTILENRRLILYFQNIYVSGHDNDELYRKPKDEDGTHYTETDIKWANYFEREKMKKIKLTSSLTLEHFSISLPNYGVDKYPMLPRSQQKVVDSYFESSCIRLRREFPFLSSILFLQYRKAVKVTRLRRRLIELAIDVMILYMGFKLPVTCLNQILEYLTADDVEYFIYQYVKVDRDDLYGY